MSSVPTASLRLQLTPTFDFAAATARLDTIAALGVSHLYLSPIAEAVRGSTHGYDVTDHTAIRGELGGAEGLDLLLDAAAERSIGVIVDHVPNHVSVEHAELNAPWWDTLRDGHTSPAAAWFDIDWQAADGRVIVPKLGAPLDEMLAAGDITTGVGDLGPEVRVGTLRFPLAPGTENGDGTGDLADVLNRQHYRLTYWRDPQRNVRRFFTIDDLVAVRVEDREVAATVDTIPRRLVDHPAFAGVRVDHVDGLAAPGDYLAGLRELIGDRLLFVEKIVAAGEELPRRWPVDGTTGYEQIAVAEHVLLDPAATAPLLRAWGGADDVASFHELERVARAEVLAGGLAPDFDRLAGQAAEADDTLASTSIRSALDALTLSIERYRTYLPDDPASDSVFDEVVERACVDVDAHGIDPQTVRDVARVIRDDADLLARWQQLTGPAVAKGGEDRAFYRWFPLASLCEVGGEPARFSIPVAEFHEVQQRRQRTHPASMLAETTHDTKRSAGVRARSLALAARAEEWAALVADWTTEHAAMIDTVSGAGGEGDGLVHLALQTAATAQPLDAERLGDYLVKAAREADLVTSWIDPDDTVESGLRSIAAQTITDATTGALTDLVGRIEHEGDAVGLALLALQTTCPGFADLYQGSPRRLLTLVDPDNRAPVDWDGLEELVGRVRTSDTRAAFADGEVDLARAILTERLLHLRRRRPEAFGDGAGYVALDASGPGADHVVAYARTDGRDAQVVVIVTRALRPDAELDDVEIDLPDGTWRSLTIDDAAIETGGRRRLADLVNRLGDDVLRFEVLERIDG